jgi:hypothetical protein
MANEPQPLVRPSEALDEADYRTFCAALQTSERGRAFLAEYARRNRHADTQVLLAALDRIEARIRADGAALTRLRDELRLLLAAIRVTRAGTERGNAEKLASLLALLERRIAALVSERPADASPADAPAQSAQRALSVVPVPDEPELPIPSPAALLPPPIALVHEHEKSQPVATPAQGAAAANARLLPEVTLFDAGSAPREQTGAPEIAKPFEQIAFARKSDAPPRPERKRDAAQPPDKMTALMAILALSEEERLALFT